MQAENLVTWTKYWGFDPEISSGPDGIKSLGIDRGVYPQARTFTVSVDKETQAMKLTDAQTQEEITLNSIAQQANQPTMSGQ